MTNVNADTNPIVVDKAALETDGSTTITYEKDESEELWERLSGSGWSAISKSDLFKRVATATAETKGKFPFGGFPFPPKLKPGQTYEVGIFTGGHGPLTTDPIRKSYLKVFCVWKKPEDRNLITDENEAVGGTWYWHQIHTKVPTDIITIGVSRIPPTIDKNGIPHLHSPEGARTAPLVVTNDHQVEINPLLPGNHYFFVVVVTDAFGNWDIRQPQFTTLRRQLKVEFPTVHIFNDGDPSSHGEGEFWFRVYLGQRTEPNVVQDFHLPTQDIDDWGETDRPYPVGFAHVGSLQVVNPGEETVSVSSWAVEHDGFLESDEGAGGDSFLPLPAGRFKETVTNRTFRMDCPVTTTDDDFHYGVDVRWSVAYMP